MPAAKTPEPIPVEPIPVEIASSTPLTVETSLNPLPVTIEGDFPKDPNRSASITSSTPRADALHVAASRKNRINVLWEGTQAFLAVALTVAAVYAATISTRPESETLKNALFVVLGFYFGRTNHARPTATDPSGILTVERLAPERT